MWNQVYDCEFLCKNTLGTNWVQRLPFWLIWRVKVSLHLWSYLLLASLLTPADGGCGNVFDRVCLSAGGFPHVTVSRDALELTIQGPSAPTLPLDMGPHCIGTPPPPWHLVAKTGDLFKSDHLRTPRYWHLVATKACTVGKHVVCIILGCFLVVVVTACRQSSRPR